MYKTDLIFSANFYKSSFTIPSIVQNPPIPTIGFFLCVCREEIQSNLKSIFTKTCLDQLVLNINSKKAVLPYEFALIDESVRKLMKCFTKLSDLNHFQTPNSYHRG